MRVGGVPQVPCLPACPPAALDLFLPCRHAFCFPRPGACCPPACSPPLPSPSVTVWNVPPPRAGEGIDQAKHSTQETMKEAKHRADEAARPGANPTR